MVHGEFKDKVNISLLNVKIKFENKKHVFIQLFNSFEVNVNRTDACRTE